MKWSHISISNQAIGESSTNKHFLALVVEFSLMDKVVFRTVERSRYDIRRGLQRTLRAGQSSFLVERRVYSNTKSMQGSSGWTVRFPVELSLQWFRLDWQSIRPYVQNTLSEPVWFGLKKRKVYWWICSRTQSNQLLRWRWEVTNFNLTRTYNIRKGGAIPNDMAPKHCISSN